jgi:tripartite-type tricarboxylate transporter receptor subunit TctC
VQALLGLTAAGLVRTVSARDTSRFPTRPIRLLVGFPPGNILDAPLRTLADEARSLLHEPIVLEYRPGAGGVLPALSLNQAPADGHTLAVLTSGLFRSPYHEQFKGDPVTDLSYIIGLSGWVFGLVVPASSPFRTVADYVAHARTHPGELSFATPGQGSVPHLVMEELARRAGVRFNHIPHKGTAEALRNLAGGHVQSSADASGWIPQVASGQLRLLCVFGDRRLPIFPEVPTLRESGYDIADTAPWGLVAPKDTPAEVVAMDGAAFRELLSRYGMEPAYMGPEAYREWAAGRRRWELRRAGEKP